MSYTPWPWKMTLKDDNDFSTEDAIRLSYDDVEQWMEIPK